MPADDAHMLPFSPIGLLFTCRGRADCLYMIAIRALVHAARRARIRALFRPPAPARHLRQAFISHADTRAAARRATLRSKCENMRASSPASASLPRAASHAWPRAAAAENISFSSLHTAATAGFGRRLDRHTCHASPRFHRAELPRYMRCACCADT